MASAGWMENLFCGLTVAFVSKTTQAWPGKNVGEGSSCWIPLWVREPAECGFPGPKEPVGLLECGRKNQEIFLFEVWW